MTCFHRFQSRSSRTGEKGTAISRMQFKSTLSNWAVSLLHTDTQASAGVDVPKKQANDTTLLLKWADRCVLSRENVAMFLARHYFIIAVCIVSFDSLYLSHKTFEHLVDILLALAQMFSGYVKRVFLDTKICKWYKIRTTTFLQISSPDFTFEWNVFIRECNVWIL